MALDFVGISKGLELDNASVMIPLTGTPGGGDSDAVGIGSIGLSDNGNIYRKKTAGAGADKWEALGNLDQISWREPALVKEDTVYASLAAAETAMNGGTVDGETVVEGDRILYTAITGENKNVFVIAGTPGAGATLVEDANAATINDVIRIDSGTSAELVFYYDGAAWVEPDAAILAELGFIRAFIGKPSAGNVLPQYTDERVVTDNDSLNTAVDKLDEVANVRGTFAAVPAATPTVIASLLVDDIRSASFDVCVLDTSNSRVQHSNVEMVNDGFGAADATTSNAIEAGKVKIGGNIGGLSLDHSLVGVGAAQVMNLTFTATNICDVTVMMTGNCKTT